MVRTFDSSLRRVTILWLFSLASIAVLALSSDILVSNQVTRSETFAEFVNLTGRQRMWTSQIALHATQFVFSASPAERATYSRRLRQSLDTMRIEYNLVLEETAQIPAIVHIFQDGDTPVSQISASYWESAEELLALPPDQVSASAPAYVRIQSTVQFLLTQFDAVTRSLVDFNSNLKVTLQQINYGRVLVVLIVLAMQFVFVFRPTLKRLRQRAGALEREIAERKRVESELRISEARFRLLVETAPVGIFQTDLQGATTWVNTRWKEIMGFTDEDVNRSRWIDAIHPDDRAAALAEGKRRREAGLPVALDYRIVRPDGSVAVLTVNAVPTVDSSNQPTGMLGTMIDITERKVAEERALKLESERQRIKVLGEFIRDTSHDLRTPLTVIKSGLSLCRKLFDVERIHEKTIVLEEYVNYLNVVIDQLQEMAVLDSLTDLTLAPIDIVPLLTDLQAGVKSRPDAALRTVTLDIAADLPQVLGSADKLLSALRAVFDNARRYTGGSGQIDVSAKAEHGQVIVTISDNGIGIAPEHLPHVFERFYKVDHARGVGGGAGLGLPIAKRIIDLHGGLIDIESVPGAGTSVRLALRAC